MQLRSPAKVNLFLKVLGKRPDHYHELATLMQAVSLFDHLTFKISNTSSDQLTCNHQTIPTDQNNLILKATNLFRKKTKIPLFLSVHLEKNIPSEAGLGGGSSNAATTLFAINTLAGNPASIEQLATWSGEIGSDIPFFFSTGCALCKGRGEIVEDIPLTTSRPVTIVKPPFGLSTPKVFQSFKQQVDTNFDLTALVQRFLDGELPLFNDLEQTAIVLQPELNQEMSKMKDAGCINPTLSGSGTAIFSLSKPNKPLKTSYQANFSYRKTNTWEWSL